MNNYQKKLGTMIASGQLKAAPGTVTLVSASHDAWCRIHHGGECNCDPDVQAAVMPQSWNPTLVNPKVPQVSEFLN